MDNVALRTLNNLVIIAAMLMGWTTGFAQELATAKDSVLLVVSGNISISNAQENDQPVAEFDRHALRELETVSIRTTTDWTDGVVEFRGPLARDVLERVGARGQTITGIALNDYQVEIPLHDLLDYPVLLATEMNGKTLTRRDKGPIWIVYPRDDYPELNNPETNTKWIWQLKKLVIE